jgi:hypothetical protein
MITKIKVFSGLAVISLICLLTVYCLGIKNQLRQIKSENRLVAAALGQAQADLAAIRAQYLLIQKEVNHVAVQKQEIDKRTSALQLSVAQSQRQTPCRNAAVPDDVTHRLRERAAEVNAAATDARRAVSALPGA